MHGAGVHGRGGVVPDADCDARVPFSIFKAQDRIFKSTKKWREEALEKQWLVEYDESSGKVVIFVSHT